MKKAQLAKRSDWRWLNSGKKEKIAIVGEYLKIWREEPFGRQGRWGFYAENSHVKPQFVRPISEDRIAKPLEFRYIEFRIEGLKFYDM